jgi:hypothetical protein
MLFFLGLGLRCVIVSPPPHCELEAEGLPVHPYTAVTSAQAVRSLEPRLLDPTTPSILFFGQQERPSFPPSSCPRPTRPSVIVHHCSTGRSSLRTQNRRHDA